MPNTREVFFEFTQVGHSMKVVAIDAASGVEVSTVAPVSASEFEWRRVALLKLEARLRREGQAVDIATTPLVRDTRGRSV